MLKNTIKIGKERFKIDSILRYKPYDYMSLDLPNVYYIVVYYYNNTEIKISFNSELTRNNELDLLDQKLTI